MFFRGKDKEIFFLQADKYKPVDHFMDSVHVKVFLMFLFLSNIRF